MSFVSKVSVVFAIDFHFVCASAEKDFAKSQFEKTLRQRNRFARALCFAIVMAKRFCFALTPTILRSNFRLPCSQDELLLWLSFYDETFSRLIKI